MPVKRTVVIAGVLCGLIAIGFVQAQELANRLAQNNWVRFGLVGGRMTFEGTRLGSARQSTNGPKQKEVFSIHNESGQLSLNYERTSKVDQVTIEINAVGNRVVLRRTPRDDSSVVPVEFSQISDEKMSLTFGAGDGQQVLRARSLWHLLAVHPKECREHLIPLLEMLRPKWRLAEMAVAAEDKLAKEVGSNLASDRTHWASLVEQLASENFAKREAADRALRMGDVNAIAYLRQLDFTQLDAEQQFRIRRILETLTGQNGDDSVEQIAASLATDPMVWLTLLSRSELATRQTAAQQLTSLLGEPIQIDPAADPDTQRDAREQLRMRIEEK